MADIIQIAAVQMEGEPGGLDVNLPKAERLVKEAAARGARYVLFPECYALFPIVFQARAVREVEEVAVPVPGALTDRFCAIAHRLDLHIAVGIAEKRVGKLFNTVLFISPELGITGSYSKRVLITHEGVRKVMEKMTGQPIPPPTEPLGPEEREIFAPSTTDGVVMWGGMKVGVNICADGGFDPLWRPQAEQGVRLFCYPVANSGRDVPGTDTPMDIARRYHTPLVFCNHMRHAALHIGNSRIVDRDGNVLAQAGPNSDEIICADIELAEQGEGNAPCAVKPC